MLSYFGIRSIEHVLSDYSSKWQPYSYGLSEISKQKRCYFSNVFQASSKRSCSVRHARREVIREGEQ